MHLAGYPAGEGCPVLSRFGPGWHHYSLPFALFAGTHPSHHHPGPCELPWLTEARLERDLSSARLSLPLNRCPVPPVSGVQRHRVEVSLRVLDSRALIRYKSDDLGNCVALAEPTVDSLVEGCSNQIVEPRPRVRSLKMISQILVVCELLRQKRLQRRSLIVRYHRLHTPFSQFSTPITGRSGITWTTPTHRQSSERLP